MKDNSCKTIKVSDFKENVCKSYNLLRECQVYLFICHLAYNVKNVSRKLEVCVLDYQDLTSCKGVKDMLCGNLVPINGVGCPDLLIIYRSMRAIKCYIIELKLDVNSGKIDSKDIARFNYECDQSRCCSSAAVLERIIVVKDNSIVRKIKGRRIRGVLQSYRAKKENIKIVAMCDIGNIIR
jgi:hypothetical protein